MWLFRISRSSCAERLTELIRHKTKQRDHSKSAKRTAALSLDDTSQTVAIINRHAGASEKSARHQTNHSRTRANGPALSLQPPDCVLVVALTRGGRSCATRPNRSSRGRSNYTGSAFSGISIESCVSTQSAVEELPSLERSFHLLGALERAWVAHNHQGRLTSNLELGSNVPYC